MSDSAKLLGSQALHSSVYSMTASVVTMSLGFARSVILARLLLPALFGTAALAMVFLELVFRLTFLDVDAAIIHQQRTDGHLVGSFAAMRIGMGLLTTAIAIALSPLIAYFYPEYAQLGTVLRVFALINMVATTSQVMEIMLRKQLDFKRLAIMDIASSVVMTVVAPLLALRGAGVWSLVGEYGSGVAVRFILGWMVFLPWRPAWHVDKQSIAWFWRFSRPLWLNGIISFILERASDFWVGTRLGDTSLGFHTKAVEYTRYTRRALVIPLVTVAQPVFARLQQDRLRLSQSFARTTGLLVRATFGIAAVIFTSAPYLVTILLGERWVFIILPLQVLALYIMLDPIIQVSEAMLLAVGKTGKLARIRTVQLAAFIPSLILLTRIGGISGAAAAICITALVGSCLLLMQVRHSVDYSFVELFVWPLTATVGGAAMGYLTTRLSSPSTLPTLTVTIRMVVTGASVIGVTAIGYLGILWAAERKRLLATFRGLASLWRRD